MVLNQGSGNSEYIDDTPQSSREALTARLAAGARNFEDRSTYDWLQLEIQEGRMSETKLAFYIDAAAKWKQILTELPSEFSRKKPEISDRIKDMLDTPSGGNRQEKKEQLESFYRSVLKLKKVKESVASQARKTLNIPGARDIERRIWQRFLGRFEQEAKGNILDEALVTGLEKSVETTFAHLGHVLSMQQQIQKQLQNPAFDLQSDRPPQISMRQQILSMVENQLDAWLDGKRSLKDWSKYYEEILHRLSPEHIQRSAEAMQSFDKTFWASYKQLSPEFFREFWIVFRWSSEKEFFSKHSLTEIRSLLPAQIKLSLLSDLQFATRGLFPETERRSMLAQLRGISDKRPSDMVKMALEFQKKAIQAREKAVQETAKVQRFFARKDIPAAESIIAAMEQTYGPGVFEQTNVRGLAENIRRTRRQIEYLKNIFTMTRDSAGKEMLRERIRSLTSEPFESEAAIDAARKNETSKAVEAETNTLLALREYEAAQKEADKLRGVDDMLHKKLVARAQHGMKDQKDEPPEAANDNAEGKVELSGEQMQKVRFLEMVVEVAKIAKDQCSSVYKIPTDPPSRYWLDPLNRLKYLDDFNMTGEYRRLTREDPNTPKHASPNGFRPYWVDIRTGDNLTGAAAAGGISYLQRIKTSPHGLLGLAGVFSRNWKGPESPVLTPDMAIDLANAEINRVKSSGVPKAAQSRSKIS